MKTVLKAAVASAAALLVAGAAHAATLDDIKKAGALNCGVSQGLPGFSNPDDKGSWTGIDVDYCKALAAAVLGDANKVKFVPLSAKVRFTALQSGEIDVLSRNTTWTFTRDTNLGLNFSGVLYYDGQGFMVRKKLGVKSARELAGAAVCTNTGTTTELNLADYFRSNGMKYKVVAFESANEVVAAYDAGRCDVFTTDRSGLAAQRTKLAPSSVSAMPTLSPASASKDLLELRRTGARRGRRAHGAPELLPEAVEARLLRRSACSKEPLGPVVRQGDAVLAKGSSSTSPVRDRKVLTLHALITVAEELGVRNGRAGDGKRRRRRRRGTRPSARSNSPIVLAARISRGPDAPGATPAAATPARMTRRSIPAAYVARLPAAHTPRKAPSSAPRPDATPKQNPASRPSDRSLSR